MLVASEHVCIAERRLKKIKGKNKPEPSSRDIIDSLACFRDDQMRRFMDKDHSSTVLTTTTIVDEDVTASAPVSYLQRRLYPERQALNMEELFELLKDDELACIKTDQEEEDEEEHSPASVACERVSQIADGGKTASAASDECGKLSKHVEESGIRASSAECDLSSNLGGNLQTDCLKIDNDDTGLPSVKKQNDLHESEFEEGGR